MRANGEEAQNQDTPASNAALRAANCYERAPAELTLGFDRLEARRYWTVKSRKWSSANGAIACRTIWIFKSTHRTPPLATTPYIGPFPDPEPPQSPTLPRRSTAPSPDRRTPSAPSTRPP